MTMWWWMSACVEPSTTTPPGTTTPPETTPPAPATDVSWRLHEDFGTIVLVDWTQADAAEARVEFTIDDGATWRSSPPRALDAGAHEELLLGVPYGADARFRVVLEDVPSEEQTATTADPPQGLPEFTIRAYDPARVDLVTAPYVFLSLGDLTGQFWVLILDREGRAVWAYRTPPGFGAIHPRVAKDGRSLYIDHDSYWTSFDGGAASQILNLAIDGTVLHTFDTPGLHHPFTDLPDGSVAWAAEEGSYDNELVKIVHRDDSVDTLFDCQAWFANAGIGGWCGSNTLNYRPETDRYLFSLFSIETIVEIDGTTGQATRWFGHAPGSWGFDPPGSAFWWQHGGYVTDAGTLLTSADSTADGGETIIREYTFDDAHETLDAVWTFGIGEGVYGQYAGEAIRLGNGATWHNYGQLARMREATPEGDVVWDIEWYTDYLGRSMPLADLYALALPLP